MTELSRLCGTAPDSEERRLEDLVARPWNLRSWPAKPTRSGTLLQLIANIRNQRLFGTCAGQAFGAGVDAQVLAGPPLMLAPYASGVSLYREARRRAGLPLNDPTQGTRFQDVADGLVARGWDRYRKGEDSDPEEVGVGAPEAGDDLADELFAHDTKKRVARVFRIRAGASVTLDLVDNALGEGVAVMIATGVREPYFSLNPDVLATREHLGGNANGHGQRIAGRLIVNGERVYLIQNSWGHSFGGCTVEGRFYPGCCLATAEVVHGAWDLYAMEIADS